MMQFPYLAESIELYGLIICSVLYCCFGDEQCFGQIVEELNNKITDVSSIGSFEEDSVMKCGKRCMENSECTSFFYEKSTLFCQLHSKVLTNQDVCLDSLTPLPGSTYYLFCPDRSGTPTGCPPTAGANGYLYDSTRKKCYKVVKTEKTWNQQNATCTGTGGHLFRVMNQCDYDWLKTKTLDTCGGGSFVCEFHIDGDDLENEGKWFFSNGDPVEFVKWAPDKPDNHNNNQHCMTISGLYAVDGFNDVPCDQEDKYGVCQVDLN